MQSLWSTSIRRLRPSLGASVTRPPTGPLLSVLFSRTRAYASASQQWKSSVRKTFHQFLDDKEEKHSRFEATDSASPGVTDPTNTLLLMNLPFSTKEGDLRRIFSRYGPIHRVEIVRNSDGSSAGHGYLRFRSTESAIEVNKDHERFPLTIHDRRIWMSYRPKWTPAGGPDLPPRTNKERSESRPTIFVGNLHYKATEQDVLETLTPFGEVTSVKIVTSADNTSKGCAHVDFKNTGEAEKVLKRSERHPIRILNREVRLDRASPLATGHPPSPRLYFSGWEGSKPSLRSHFRALGSKVVDILLLENHDPNVVTRTGFVEFCDLETAAEALARFNSPELLLAYSRPRDPSEQGLTTKVRSRKFEGSKYGLKKRRERSSADG